MDVLIIFETMEGQTGKVARFAADQVAAMGMDARLLDASGLETVSFQDVGMVILAAPVHERRHPRLFEALLAAHCDDLRARRTMMLSVSLSAAFPEGLEEANDYLTEMKMRTGFEPDREVLVAGAVRFSQYDYFARQVVQHVVLKSRNMDPIGGEYEFTDWTALKAAIADFVGDEAAAAGAGAEAGS